MVFLLDFLRSEDKGLQFKLEDFDTMSTGSTSLRRLPRFINSSIDSNICKSCRKDISRRHYASTAAAVAEPSSTVSPPPPPAVDASPSVQPSYRINAGLLLSRPPQITRDLEPFEKAFYFYQKRLNERLSQPFTRYFYFKRGTPAYLEWRREMQGRQTAARDIGKYNAYSEEAWNDELLVGAEESEPESQLNALIQHSDDGSPEDSKRELVERPMPRVTDADISRDQKSLNRLLQRTLYLLVRKEKDWILPSAIVQGKESLREVAESLLVNAAGVNMNTWFAGHAPVGHLVHDFQKTRRAEEKEVHFAGEKTFFMKARIMAGQADLTGNKLEYSEFKWLAKEEVQVVASTHYFNKIKNMLAER